jgi:hypothetical protein
MTVVRPVPSATKPRAATATRFGEKRSIKVAANGAVTPYTTRFTAKAVEVRLRDHPNSISSGMNKIEVVDLNAAAQMRVRNVTAATSHAR